MFIIPGFLISIVTFPGVVVHEWAHKKFCDWLGVKVHAVVYFRFGNPAGYVTHDHPSAYKQIFWISIGPMIINSLLTIILGYFTSQIIQTTIMWNICIWLAFSIGMHSFPSDSDMQSIWFASKKEARNGGSPIHYLAFILVAIVWLLNKLRFFWIDLFYAAFLVMLGGQKF